MSINSISKVSISNYNNDSKKVNQVQSKKQYSPEKIKQNNTQTGFVDSIKNFFKSIKNFFVGKKENESVKYDDILEINPQNVKEEKSNENSLSRFTHKEELEKLGFSEDIISKLDKNGYGSRIVDETLDMVLYLENKLQEGTPITEDLIESSIDEFAPGASGSSAATQRSWLANIWTRGADVYKAYNQEPPIRVGKREQLDKMGFTKEVIFDLDKNGYGSKIVDETLKMALYLEDKIQEGTPLTEDLIESSIDKYAPGASGSSASTQLSWLANIWNRGADVYKAYNQEPPADVLAKLPN